MAWGGGGGDGGGKGERREREYKENEMVWRERREVRGEDNEKRRVGGEKREKPKGVSVKGVQAKMKKEETEKEHRGQCSTQREKRERRMTHTVENGHELIINTDQICCNEMQMPSCSTSSALPTFKVMSVLSEPSATSLSCS